jgi:hypothetical protein
MVNPASNDEGYFEKQIRRSGENELTEHVGTGRQNRRQHHNSYEDVATVQRQLMRINDSGPTQHNNHQGQLKKNTEPIPLTKEQKQNILSAVGSQKTLLFCEDEASKNLLAQSASIAERIMLEYKPLHEAFFSMIRWNEKEEQQKNGGLNIKTLELLPPQKLIFKWFSNWNASAILRKVGLPKFIALENSKIYASCSAICALVMESEEPENFLQTGMGLQRIWLTATRLGLSMQPIAGVLYLHQRLTASGLPDIPENQKKLIITAVNNIQHTFNNPAGIITMMFRIGQSGPPSARSIKFPPKITYQSL